MTGARPLVVALLMLGVHVRCAGDAPAQHGPLVPGSMPGASGPAVLFIGNSLTEANDLPQRVAELSRDAGAAVEVSALVAPGFSLEDHLATGQAASRIQSRCWSMVVLQQGPSTLPESRAALIRDAQRLATLARAVGARAALLMVWPLPGQRQVDVAASYRAAAQATDSLLLPAGEAWQAALARDPSLTMTVSDGFHPTALGTYLAALTIHCTVNRRLPAAVLAADRVRTGVALTAQQDAVLREAACAGASGP